MSTGQPWYRRYPGDFIGGTLQLTLEEKGAYSIALDLMYQRGGPIPDDPQWIARVCGCPVQRWKKIRARLIEVGKLNLTDDGRLANGRATYEMQRDRNRSAVQSARGRKGGRPPTAENLQKTSKLFESFLPDFPTEGNEIKGLEKPRAGGLRDSESLKKQQYTNTSARGAAFEDEPKAPGDRRHPANGAGPNRFNDARIAIDPDDGRPVVNGTYLDAAVTAISVAAEREPPYPLQDRTIVGLLAEGYEDHVIAAAIRKAVTRGNRGKPMAYYACIIREQRPTWRPLPAEPSPPEPADLPPPAVADAWVPPWEREPAA